LNRCESAQSKIFCMLGFQIRSTSLTLASYKSSAERAFALLRGSVCNSSVCKAGGLVFCVKSDLAAFVDLGKQFVMGAQHIGCMKFVQV